MTHLSNRRRPQRLDGYRCPIASFSHAGQQIAYTEYGSGGRTVILIHGLLLSQRMHEPLARALAERGNHVVTIDLLGHGRSDRPPDMWRYSMTEFGREVEIGRAHV